MPFVDFDWVKEQISLTDAIPLLECGFRDHGDHHSGIIAIGIPT